MKKLFLLSVLILLPMLSSADAVEIDGIYYNLIEKAEQAEVTKNPKKYSGSVDIPESIVYEGKTYGVTSIGEKAFYNCSGLTSLTIGNSVTSIGGYAFSGCSGLTSLTIGNSVTSIGGYAFSRCSGLTSVTIPNSVKSIGESAFQECKSLTSVTIGNSVTSIGEDAFHGCSGLTSVTIGNSVTSIGNSTFSGCSSLASVTIPNSVTSIGKFAFFGCSGLTSVHITDLAAWCNIDFVNSSSNPLNNAHHLYLNGEEVKNLVIPNSVTSIGGYAFSGCSGLTSLTIGNSVTSIGGYAFSGCSGLTSLTIGNSVTSIGNSTFSGCSSLASVTIGNSVTSIGSCAFYNCQGLTSVQITDLAAWCNISFETEDSNPLWHAYHLYLNGEEVKDLVIPTSVTSIGNYAFYNCQGLTSVTIGNSVTSIGYAAFYNCSGLTSLIIPNSLTSISGYAFSGCSGLTSLTIPNSVTSIGNGAFSGVDIDIATVISLIENPFIISSSVFSYKTVKNATLYVPKGTIDKYKTTEGWKDFLFIEEGTGPNGGGGETPEAKKCATPTIGYQNGKLTFNCETEGATCQYTITDDDIKSGSANEIQLGVTYRISVYATKSGFDNSETATATLCWIDVEPKTEGITNNVAQVRANAVLIQNSGNTLTISGADDGTPISVYAVNGQLLGTSTISNGQASVQTLLQSGNVAIVKIGDKSVKVLMK